MEKEAVMEDVGGRNRECKGELGELRGKLEILKDSIKKY